MKYILLSIIFILILFPSYSEETASRIYMFKMISFYQEYEVFCTKEPLGYYKYPQEVNNTTVYLTYECNTFFEQSKFDENLTIFDLFYPMNLWASIDGGVFRLKKRYSPVIEKNQERKNFHHGFGKN